MPERLARTPAREPGGAYRGGRNSDEETTCGKRRSSSNPPYPDTCGFGAAAIESTAQCLTTIFGGALGAPNGRGISPRQWGPEQGSRRDGTESFC